MKVESARVFEVTECELGVKIIKFKLPDPIWWTLISKNLWNSRISIKLRTREFFGVAEYELGIKIKNSKF